MGKHDAGIRQSVVSVVSVRSQLFTCYEWCASLGMCVAQTAQCSASSASHQLARWVRVFFSWRAQCIVLRVLSRHHLLPSRPYLVNFLWVIQDFDASVLHVPDSIKLLPAGHIGWVGLGLDPFPPRHVKEPLSMSCLAFCVRAKQMACTGWDPGRHRSAQHRWRQEAKPFFPCST